MSSSPVRTRPPLRRLRTALAGTALLAVMAASVTACVSRDDSVESVGNDTVALSDLSDLTLRVGDQKGGTETLLRAAGQLDGLPFKVEFSPFTSGPPEIEAATAGKIDFAVTGNTPPIFGVASNAKVKIVSAYSNDSSGDTILVRGDGAPTSVAGLKGKKVAVAKGSSAHGNLLLQLEKAGLKISDVEPVFLQPAEAAAAFTSGAVDAWAIWDPYTALAQLNPGVKTIATGSGVTNGFGFGLASNEALADAKRNTALRELVVRIAKASAWAKANNAEWSSKYAATVGIDPRAAEAAQGRSLRPAIEITDAVVESEQKLADTFTDSGQLPNKVDFGAFVDRRYNDAVKPYTVPLQ